jgi:hypothetical protein
MVQLEAEKNSQIEHWTVQVRFRSNNAHLLHTQ